MLNLDEIYELFIWDKSYTDEEYEARVNKGIAEAAKFKNIYPFIQPIIVPAEKSKVIWEPCAKVVSKKSDAELEQYVYLLFEWLKDMNWPGAWIIFDRLLKMPFSEIEEKYSYCRKQAEREEDELWLMALDDFLKTVKNN